MARAERGPPAAWGASPPPAPEHLGWGLRTCITHKPGGTDAGGLDSTLRSSAPVPGWAAGRCHHPRVEQTLWCACYLFLLFLLTGREKWGRIPREPGEAGGATRPQLRSSLLLLCPLSPAEEATAVSVLVQGGQGLMQRHPGTGLPTSTPPPTPQAPQRATRILSRA